MIYVVLRAHSGEQNKSWQVRSKTQCNGIYALSSLMWWLLSVGKVVMLWHKALQKLLCYKSFSMGIFHTFLLRRSSTLSNVFILPPQRSSYSVSKFSSYFLQQWMTSVGPGPLAKSLAICIPIVITVFLINTPHFYDELIFIKRNAYRSPNIL